MIEPLTDFRKRKQVNGKVFSVGGFYELNHESYDFGAGLSMALNTTLNSKLFVELVPFSYLQC